MKLQYRSDLNIIRQLNSFRLLSATSGMFIAHQDDKCSLKVMGLQHQEARRRIFSSISKQKPREGWKKILTVPLGDVRFSAI
jgi:hypothetical protein